MSKDLAGLFAPPSAGVGTQSLTAGVCTAWDAGTSHSTVVVGTVVYANLPILTSAVATMGTGAVLLIATPRGPLILGRLTVPT